MCSACPIAPTGRAPLKCRRKGKMNGIQMPARWPGPPGLAALFTGPREPEAEFAPTDRAPLKAPRRKIETLRLFPEFKPIPTEEVYD